MNSGTDLRPVLGVMLIASLVLIVVNAILFSRSGWKKDQIGQNDTPKSIAFVLGLAGALAWTVVLWPVMTSKTSGAYIIRVNGVTTSGGFITVMNGLVPFFIMALALIALPMLLGRGIQRMQTKSSARKEGGKPSIGVLVLSIFAIVVGFIFVATVISFINSPGAQVSPVGAAISAAIGVVCIALGIFGIIRFIIRSRRARA